VSIILYPPLIHQRAMIVDTTNSEIFSEKSEASPVSDSPSLPFLRSTLRQEPLIDLLDEPIVVSAPLYPSKQRSGWEFEAGDVLDSVQDAFTK